MHIIKTPFSKKSKSIELIKKSELHNVLPQMSKKKCYALSDKQVFFREPNKKHKYVKMELVSVNAGVDLPPSYQFNEYKIKKGQSIFAHMVW